MSLNPPKYDAFDPARDLKCDDSFIVPSWLAACGLAAAGSQRITRAAGVPAAVPGKHMSAVKTSTGKPLRGGFALTEENAMGELLCAGNENGELYFIEIHGDTPVIRGRIKLQGTILCRPIFHEGLFFCTTAEGVLYAIRTTAGDEGGPLRNSIEWQKKLKKGIMTSPAALPGVVLVAPLDGLYGLASGSSAGRSAGTALWGASISGTMSTPCVIDNTILIGTEDRRLMAFDVISGRLAAKWECGMAAACRTAPAVAALSGLAAAIAIDGTLLCAGFDDGGYRWSFRALSPAPGGVAAAELPGGGCFLFGTEKGVFYCIDALGRKSWEYDAGGSIRTEPLVHDGMVFFGAGNEKFICLDAATGSEVSVIGVEGELSAKPAVAGNRLVFATTGGYFYAVAAE